MVDLFQRTKPKLPELARIKVAVKSDDIVLRDPVSRERITTKGKVVKKTPFWIRRIKAGDCFLIEDVEPKITPLEGETDGD